MFYRNLAFNSLCFIILILVCNKDVVANLANEPSCIEKSSLIPYNGSCDQSSQCITDYCNDVCFCPVNTYYNNCTASCVLNCNATVPDSSGQIVSLNYPSQYPNSSLCSWSINGNSNTYFLVSITDMDIENSDSCSYDSLEIYDGTSEANTQLAMFCNSNGTNSKIVTSSKNAMHLVFRTDDTVQGRGFRASYQRYDYNATITESRYGYIASPGYPLKNLANSYNSWTILGSPNSFISLSISDMDIEYHTNCAYDSLKIYDGTSETDTLLDAFCNRDDTSTHIVASSTNSMHLVFKTDYSVQGRGFSASYTCYDYNTTITEPRNGYITSPGYPLMYPKHSYFSWTIQGGPRSYISLRFSDIDIEINQTENYLKIYDGYNASGTMLSTCYFSGDCDIIASVTNSMHLVFKTLDSVHGKGFSIAYRINGYYETIMEPEIEFIVSPGYPIKYPENSYFSWTIQGSPGSFVILSMFEINVEDGPPYYDFIQVYDGNSSNSRLLAKMCSDHDDQTVVMSSGSSLHVVFRTDSYNEKSGFLASYEINDCHSFWIGTGWSIVSPGYPHDNVQNLNCSWTFITDATKHFFLRITDIDLNDHLNCTYNYLKIYDGVDVHSPLLGIFCDALSGASINSTSNYLLLVLETYGTHSYKGFSATYSTSDYDLSVLLKSTSHILTTDVTFDWTTQTPSQLIAYTITWVATEDSTDRGEMVASPSGVHVQGLTQGTEYNFTVLSIIKGDDYYKDTIVPTFFTFETLPAPPGQLNESSSNLHSIPYVLRFGPSEGRVAGYNIIVGGKTYEVFNPELTIKELTPDTQYNYTIIAYNKRGNGSEEVTGSFKIDSAAADREEESLNVALVAGVTAGSCVVIIVGVLVVTLVVRNRRRNSKHPPREDNTESHYNEIDMSVLSTAAKSPGKSTKNKLNADKTADQRAYVNKEQIKEREYDSIKNGHTEDETYETPRTRINVGNLDGHDAVNVYNNVGNVRSQP